MKTFVVDIDGVLADFILGFTKLAAIKHPDIPVYSALQQKSWDGFAGMSETQITQTWERVLKSPNFWQDLPTLASPATFTWLNKLNLQAQVYFATNRVGKDPLYQTKQWLQSHGIFEPNVVVTKRKGEFCRVVNATYAIDDKADNASAIAWLSEREGYPARTIPFLLTRPYNQYDERMVGSKYVMRVNTFDEFLTACFASLERT